MTESSQSQLKEFNAGTESQDDTVCPTCGKRLKTRGGMKNHHFRVHDDALRIEKTCKWCNEVYEVPEAWEDRKNFCSEECYLTWSRESKLNEGENASAWKERPEVTCECCNEDFQVMPHRENEARFCSYECRDAALRGEKHPNWSGGKVSVTCKNCGGESEVVPALEQSTQFCSERCHAEWRTGKTGFDSLSYRGSGTSQIYSAVRDLLSEQNWKAIRNDVVNNSCRLCGSKKNLHVHHIIPVLAGGTNESWNLITLCQSCHGQAESFINDIVHQHITEIAELSFTSMMIWGNETYL